MKMPLWYDQEAITSISQKYDQILHFPEYIARSPPAYQLQDQTEAQESRPPSRQSQLKRSVINNRVPTEALIRMNMLVKNITIDSESLGHRPPRSRYKRNGDGNELEGQDPNIEDVQNAFPDMVRLSLPPGVEYDKFMPAWRWKDAGKGVKVYVIDSGCDTRHPEFNEANFEDWIYAAHDTLEEPRDYYTFNEGGPETMVKSHGTTVVSKIIGKRVGVAPKADIIMVQTAPTTQHENYAGFTVVNSWLKTYDHVVDNRQKRNGKYCVVTSAVSVGFAERLEPIYHAIFRHVVRSLGKMGCFVVVSAGNNVDDPDNLGYSPLDAYPQLIAGDPEIEKIKNFIVVGGHSRSFKNLFQSSPFVKISAQGVGVATVLDLNMDEDPPKGDWTATTAYGSSTGTSFGKLSIYESI
ncbi:hypothetical protein TWF281_006519 [Arthrobotrys megalospora]